MIAGPWIELLNALTNNQPHLWYLVLPGLTLTLGIIYSIGGRLWAMIYVALIPFLNWSFAIIPQFQIVAPNDLFDQGIALHPMTMVTGLVFVVRDFVQREMRHWVLLCMAFAIGWSFFYAWPVIALASGIAFAVSECVDWLLFTFTKYRLSTRILLSSAVAAPIDTTIFLFGADLAFQLQQGAEPGTMLHIANWVVFIVGKMIGAIIVARLIRAREEAGLIRPHET